MPRFCWSKSQVELYLVYALQICFHNIRKDQRNNGIWECWSSQHFLQLFCSFNWSKGWTESDSNSFCCPWSEFSTSYYIEPFLFSENSHLLLFLLEFTDRRRWRSRFWLQIPGTRCNWFPCILFQHSITAPFHALWFDSIASHFFVLVNFPCFGMSCPWPNSTLDAKGPCEVPCSRPWC